MRISGLRSVLPTAVATIAICNAAATASGSHQPHPGPVPTQGQSFLTPGYCNPDTSAAQDSSESWTTIKSGTGPHATSTLALVLTSPAGGSAEPYGAVTNNSFPIFSSLAFDASGNTGFNSGFFLDITVANNDGFLDEGSTIPSTIKTKPASTTPSGFNHYVATPTNMGEVSGAPFDQTATFVIAFIGTSGFFQNSRQTVTIANVSLNGGTFASGVLSTPSNNCFLFGNAT